MKSTDWYHIILHSVSLLIAFVEPTYYMILLIGFMVVCKAITGVMSSRKKGEKFSADKLRDTVFNFIAYGIAIIISFLIEQIVLGDFPALKTMTALICYVELKSINENIEEITGLNLFKGILSALNFKNKKV